jgi:Beta-glucan synthesis-associated protein SKN1/KRE6/Sbg1
LNITTERKVNTYKAFDEIRKVFYADKKYIQSGMLQSWNKFCFIGGVVEFSAKLPGDPHKGGLWPARKWSLLEHLLGLLERSLTLLFCGLHDSVDARELGACVVCGFIGLCMALQFQ